MQLIVVLIVRAALERPRLRVSVEDAVGEREVHEGVQQQEVAPEDMEAVAEHSAHEARHAPLPHAPLRLQRAAGASLPHEMNPSRNWSDPREHTSTTAE